MTLLAISLPRFKAARTLTEGIMSSKIKTLTRRFYSALAGWYIGGTALFIITVVLTFWVPRITQELIDGYLEGGARSELTTAALSICLIGFLVIFTRTISRVLVLWTGRLVEAELKEDYFTRILRFTQQGLETFAVGDLIARMSTDMRQIGFFFGFGSVQILNFCLTAVYVIYCMAQIHVGLTFWVLLPIVGNTILLRLATPRLFEHSRMQQRKVSDLSSRISEAFHHVHALRAEGALDSFYSSIQIRNAELHSTNVRQSSYRSAVMPSLNLLTAIAYVVVFFYGGHLVQREVITLGQLTAFNAYIALFTIPIFGVGLFVASRQRAKSACLRLEELDEVPVEPLATEPSATEPSATKTSATKTSSSAHDEPHNATAIELRHLTFRYPSKPTAVLTGMNLSLTTGEHFGIVGEIGSGKTTLFKLLLGFLQAHKGSYYLLGQNSTTLPLSTLRNTLGWVGQDTYFFSDSIRYNLCIGATERSSHDEERMIWACKQAAIYEEIMGFPQGFESPIGEDGIRLSGGQKQRLSLARALLHPRKIYLLDDIFSALDHTTEERIIRTLSSLGATLMMVSHRPSVLQFCHRVGILEGGRFSHIASPQELQHHPLFQSLVPLNSSGERST